MIGVVFEVLWHTSPRFRSGSFHHVSSNLIIVIIVALGVASIVLSPRLTRPLNGASAEALVATYRQRMFHFVGFAEIPFLVAVMATGVTGRLLFYPFGVFFAFFGLSRITPTAQHLARDQEQITSSGGTLSLVDTLDKLMGPSQSL
jgi:hypothetical protein